MKKIKKKKEKKTKVYVGLDISISGTGVSLFDNKGKHIKTYVIERSFAERARGIVSTKMVDEFKIDSLTIRKKVKGVVDLKRRFSFMNYLATEEAIKFIMKKHKVTHSIIENYAFSRHSKATTKLAELGSLIRKRLLLMGIRFLEVTPQSNKKFVTGKGNSPKDVLLQKVFKKWGEEFEDIEFKFRMDAADSYGLGLMCYHYFSNKLSGLDRIERETILNLYDESTKANE